MFLRSQQWNNRRDQARKGSGTSRGPSTRKIPQEGNQEKMTFFLDIDAARAQLGPTRLIEVFTSFKQAVTNHLLDIPEVCETIQNGGPVDIA